MRDWFFLFTSVQLRHIFELKSSFKDEKNNKKQSDGSPQPNEEKKKDKENLK